MNHVHTTVQNAALRGALVLGASWPGVAGTVGGTGFGASPRGRREASIAAPSPALRGGMAFGSFERAVAATI